MTATRKNRTDKSNRTTGAQNSTVYDRTPPQSLEAERSVLGAMLINSEAVGTAMEILREKPEEVFYAEAHQCIYGAMVSLFRENTPVDVITLGRRLSQDETLEKAGGAIYISELISSVPTSANVEYYARIVLETALLRHVITTCTQVVSEAYMADCDVVELLDRAEANIFSITEQRQLNPIHQVGDLVHDGVLRIEKQITSQTGITGIPTGFTKLDEMLSGLQPSDMLVLAARPSVGKTAFSLNIASNIANRQNKGVILFSLEMSKEQLVQRLLCMEGRVDSTRLRTGFLARNEFPKVQQAAEVLRNAPLFIDDTPNISVMEMRSKARRHAAKHPCDLIIVDYLQLMTGGGGRSENRQVEIADISRSIKGLARELKVPVIALSQLSREAEKDDSGMPKLSHLRESGAIEQDADVVMMLARLPAHESEGRSNVIRLNVAKQRNGPTGMLELLFEQNIQLFRNLTDGTPEPPPYESFDQDAPLEPAPVNQSPDYMEDYEEEDDTPF